MYQNSAVKSGFKTLFVDNGPVNVYLIIQETSVNKRACFDKYSTIFALKTFFFQNKILNVLPNFPTGRSKWSEIYREIQLLRKSNSSQFVAINL